MTHSTHIISSTTGFYTAQLSALLTYAETDHEFAAVLAHHIATYVPQSPIPHTVTTSPSRHLAPRSLAHAERITHWLLTNLSSGTTKDVRSAQTLAHAWAANYESPKDVVLGIIGLAIIGPTLGLIKSKKKKRSAMRLVVTDRFYATRTKKTLASFVATETGKQLATELRLAAGDTMKLHPDTFDWLMSDHKNEIFTDTQEDIQETCIMLATEHLPHTVVRKNDTIVAVVISPSVHEEFVRNTNAEAV